MGEKSYKPGAAGAGQSNAPDTSDAHAHEHIGPPAKFDAEPVRRRSKRWMVVLLLAFVGIVGTVGIALWQLREYRAGSEARRANKAKTDQESHALPRAGRIFALADPPGSDASEMAEAAAVPAGVTVPPMKEVGSTTPLGMNNASGLQPLAPQLRAVDTPVAPARRSMFVEMPSASADGLSTSAVTTVMPTPSSRRDQSPSSTSSSIAAISANPGQLPRAQTVQEQARRSAGNSVTATAQALAAHLGNRNYLLARGSTISCGLQTQLESNVPGEVTCVTTQDTYSDDGRVVLVEKGSLVTGEFKNTMKPGDKRIAILWSRIKTPNGIVIDVDSPAADSVGAAGVDGHIDNHWWERIGAAFMLSLVDDAIALQTAKQGAEAATAGGATQPYQQTTGTTKSIAEKVLDSTINIAPTLSRNRGHRLLILVKRDLWFDQVYSVREVGAQSSTAIGRVR